MGSAPVERMASVWRQYPSECNVKVHYKQIYFDTQELKTKFARNEGVLSKYVPAEFYLFSINRGDKKHRHRLVVNPYFSSYFDPNDKSFDKYIPATLNSEVAYKDFAKYFKSHIEAPPEMWAAYSMVISYMEGYLTSFDRATVEQVLSATEWSTSVGNFWSGMIDPDTHKPPISKRNLEASEIFQEYFERYYDSQKTDEPMLSVFTDFNKEELRLEEKVLEDKTRGVCAAAYEHTRACALELLNLHEQLMRTPIGFVFLYGFTPYYGNWDKFIKNLLQHGKYFNGSDASQFDSSIRGWFYSFFYLFCVHFMSDKDKDERMVVLLNLLRQSCFGIVVMPTNDVCYTSFGNKTGQYITYMFNCFVNLLMNAFAEVKIFNNFSHKVWFERFNLRCSGDDLLQCGKQPFDLHKVVPVLKEIGIEVTPDHDECVDILKFVFVSRHTVYVDGKYVSHGNPEKMKSAIKYNFASQHPADVIIKLCAIRRDMYYHKDIYIPLTGFIMHLFAAMLSDVKFQDDPKLGLARSAIDSESKLKFLHTGLLL